MKKTFYTCLFREDVEYSLSEGLKLKLETGWENTVVNTRLLETAIQE